MTISYKDYLEDVRRMKTAEIRRELAFKAIYNRSLVKAMEVVLAERTQSK